MALSDNLRKAKENKNDEFYTQYEDIQTELNHYEKHFEGKTVLCNCDDPFESNFCKFFLRNFNYLKLKRLICTSYNSSPVAGTQLSFFDITEDEVHHEHGFVLDVSKVPMANGRGVSDGDIDKLLKSKKWVKKLKGDGDFRSEECVELLKQADIVVTNPPFSLFREYVAQLIEYEKKFVIIGNKNAIAYKEVFPLIQNNQMWIGNTPMSTDMLFSVPKDKEEDLKNKSQSGSAYRIIDGILYARAPSIWFTNLDIKKRHEKMVLYKNYSPEEYPKYENYDAIEVNKTSEIPCDYYNVMGVPITFLDKFNPEQFEIIGMGTGALSKELGAIPYSELLTGAALKKMRDLRPNYGAVYLLDKNGMPKLPYNRIMIRRRGKK